MGGPDTTGQFKRVQVKGIHTKAVAVDEVRAGQSASFAVKVVDGNKTDRQLKRAHVRKGMVLLDPELKPRATYSWILAFQKPCSSWRARAEDSEGRLALGARGRQSRLAAQS